MSTVFTQAIKNSLNPCMDHKLQNFNSPNTNNIFEQLFTLLIYNNMTTDECNFVMDFCNKL
jgi:dTDP-4-amino-4,6-dideoxygalactose transaminase